MKLYLVRHSETNYNVQKLCNSDPTVDVHLTPKDIEQTEALAKLLEYADFRTIYISELPRTRQTAEILNKSHNSPIIVDGRLNDNKTGYESKPVQDWLSALNDSSDRWSAKFNDGESLNGAAARAISFMDDLKTSNEKSVLIVTHGFMTQAIYGYIKNISLAEASTFSLPQGTYSEFELN